MAFYRARRALSDLGVNVGRSPSSDLSRLRRVYTKSFVEILEEKSSLRLPRPALGPVGSVGLALVLIGVFGAVAGLVVKIMMLLGRWQLPDATLALLLGAFIAGLALLLIDPGRLPKTCKTLGLLAAKTARLSYGRLVKQGADASDARIWTALVEILADFAGVPAGQIAPGTYFLASTLKGQNTAA